MYETTDRRRIEAPPLRSAVAGILLMVGLAGCTDDSARPIDESVGDVLAQWATERSYRELIGPAVDTIGARGGDAADTLSDSAVVQPTRVEVDGRGRVFVLDLSDMKVKQFDPSGRFVRAFGRGTGDGEGEVRHAASLRVTDSGDVIVLDAGGRRITRFDAQGRVAGTTELVHQPNDFVATRDGGYVVLAPVADRLLTRLDGAGKDMETRFTPFDLDAPQRAVLTGSLVARPDGGYVYAPMYAGYLIGYTADLERAYYVRTVEGGRFPRMRAADDTTYVLDEPTPTSQVALAVVDDTLYTMHLTRESGAVHLDAYGAVDGAYLYSSRVPEACFPVDVTSAHVYMICNQNIVVRAERLPVPDVPDGA